MKTGNKPLDKETGFHPSDPDFTEGRRIALGTARQRSNFDLRRSSAEGGLVEDLGNRPSTRRTIGNKTPQLRDK
jgi:hypothetical protein